MYKISREKRGNITKKKRRHWTSVLKKQAKEFCLATGLHGYKYIAHTHRPKIERIIWAIIVVTSLCCAGALMREAWTYNSSRPTITVIESTHHGIWNYPFPAVTICNLNRVSLTGAIKLVRQLTIPDHLTEEFVISEMGLLNELLSPGIYGYDVTDNLTQLQDMFDTNGFTIREVLERVTQNCSSLVMSCKWKGIWTKCANIFEQSLSRDGICCSFNYITTDDPTEAPKQHPKRVTACGYQTGLSLLVNVDSEDYLATMLGSYGVKVMIHYPYDYPDHNAENKLVGMGNQVFLSISPEETYSTREVKALAVNTRDCVFSDERKLKKDYDIKDLNFTYAEYTYKNCMTDCRASTIKMKCQCIPYYYPQQGTRICDLRDVNCLKKHKSWFETSWPGVSITRSSKLDSRKRPCGCLPDCTMYRYPVESSVGVIDRTKFYSNMKALEKEAVENASMVHIFFSDLVSIQYRRNAYYNWRNVFASFGGLLGLFAGFSLMSCYELVYFFIIRVITDSWAKKKIEKSAENIENVRYDKKIIVKQRRF